MHTINNHHPPDFTQFTDWIHLIQLNGVSAHAYKVSETKISILKRSPSCSNETPVFEKHTLCKCVSAELWLSLKTEAVVVLEMTYGCWCQDTCQGFFSAMLVCCAAIRSAFGGGAAECMCFGFCVCVCKVKRKIELQSNPSGQMWQIVHNSVPRVF